ncbi:MAG: DUF4249 domain-containing protein [Muribaculaceae bacterium]|nr:DUF4249 domain-containing protein [Muribaculaceae bacterium]
MAILRYIISSLLLLSLVSCFEDFDPKIDVSPVLCINSLIKAGEPVDVKVTRSFLYTDTDYNDRYVTDAVVNIYADGERVDAHYLPQEGDLIRIEVESEKYGSASAEVKVPHAVPVKSVKLTPSVINNWFPGDGTMRGGVEYNLDLAVEIDDDPGADNYFKFDYAAVEPVADTNYGYDENGNVIWVEAANAWYYPGMFNADREPIFGEHIGAFDSAMGGDSFGFTFFTDRQFSGRSYTLHLIYTGASYSVSSREWQDGLIDCGLNITLSTISRSFYDWANYRWQAESGVIGGLGEAGLADQIWGYSNVTTNAGVVAAQSSVTYTVSLRDFLAGIIGQ